VWQVERSGGAARWSRGRRAPAAPLARWDLVLSAPAPGPVCC